ncbi:MAG: AI-2E family transporter [Flavobacteriales bacterium]
MMVITSTSIIKKIVVLFLVFAGLYYAQNFLIPLVIGGLLATVFLPFSKWLESKKIPKSIAAIICLIAILMVVAGIGSLLVWQLFELVDDFALIKEKMTHQFYRLQQYILLHFGVSAENQVLVLKEQQPVITNAIKVVAESITGILIQSILILVYIFCFIYYRIHLGNFLIKLYPSSQRKEMAKVVYHSTRVSQHYLLGLAKMISILWVMYFIGFSIVGVKNALFFAILCGLLEVIPFVGNIIGTTLTLLVAAVNGAGLPMLGGIALTYGIVQLIQGWILEPLIVGSQVKINPFFTIIALIIGQLLWGIPGIFIAIPAIAILKIVFDNVESLTPYGYLIGKVVVQKKEIILIKKIQTQLGKLIK